MSINQWLGLIVITISLVGILAVVKEWDWYMNHYKTIRLFEAVGEKVGKLFAISFCVIFIVIGILVIFEIL